MLRVLKFDFSPSPEELSRQLPRAASSDSLVRDEVGALIDAVRLRGSQALAEQSRRFEGIEPESLFLSQEQLSASVELLDPGLRSAIVTAIERVRRVSEAILPDSISVSVIPGGRVSNRFTPISAAGVYVPGGKASYPSSAIMNVVAAQVAGVERIVMASPIRDRERGLPDGTVMAAAHLLGVSEFMVAGGAGAIAALAHGLGDIGFPAVGAITGPGNKYVAAAKALVSNQVIIDSEAGPTEILVLADSSANPEYVAADLISQAEHDELAAAVLVTDSAELAGAVAEAVSRRLQFEPNRERAAAALSGSQSAIVVCANWDIAIAVADNYAAEHLSIQCLVASEVAGRIQNAGAIFIGSNSPVSLGDYLAGSNHVLPTGGSARRQSVLSPLTFLRLQQVIEYDAAALAASAPDILALTEAEGLPGHYSAVSARLESGDSGHN